MNLSPTARRFELAPKVGAIYEAAPDIGGLRLLMVNVYFIGTPGSKDWVLVDGGLFGCAARIRMEAERRFDGAPPKAIILTHGHFDHIGALRELSDTWGVPIYTHRLELPYVTGRSSYPPPDPTVGGGVMAWSSFLYPKRPIDLGDRVKALPQDGSLPGLPEWRWFHTPGHTPGHVALFRERDRAMIAGDAFVTTRQESASAVMTQRPELNGPPAYFTPDWSAARESVQYLASMHPSIVATGHGVPMRGDAMEQELQRLARDFESLAVPNSGRYVKQAAVANQNGVVSLPPRRWGVIAVCATLLGVLVTAGILAVTLRAAEEERTRRRWRR
jgi:glyoxylase-like metal-dependent hydrolase (beta-lactamase superfamily II)